MMILKTTSVIAATILLMGTISTMTPLKQTAAESSCLVGFDIVTNAEASAADPQVPEIDGNGDGLLCRKDVATPEGASQILFTDNAASTGGTCPDHFERTPWPIGTDPDRNGNGFVCLKVVSSGKTVMIDDNKPSGGDEQCPVGINGKIAFVSTRDGRQQIYKMNSCGTNETRLTNNLDNDFEPSWSPDGTQIAFASERDGRAEIYKMNSDGTNQMRLTNNPANDQNPNWSPDGTKIAFASERDGNWEIYIMNSDGINQMRLTNNPARDVEPKWSPDGTQIAFTSSGNIYKMNSDGTGVVQLTHTTNRFDQNPNWSPDGTKIAFASNRFDSSNGLDIEIYVMNSDGTEQTNLTVTDDAVDDLQPSWSPDGTKIAFATNRDGNPEIHSMNSDGANPTRLTNTLNNVQPDWGVEPDSL